MTKSSQLIENSAKIKQWKTKKLFSTNKKTNTNENKLSKHENCQCKNEKKSKEKPLFCGACLKERTAITLMLMWAQ